MTEKGKKNISQKQSLFDTGLGYSIFAQKYYNGEMIQYKNHRLPKSNPFTTIKYKTGMLNSKKLQNFAKKCDTVLVGTDWISAISPDKGLRLHNVFDIANTTNSNQKIIPIDELGFVSPELYGLGDILVEKKSTRNIDTYTFSISYNNTPLSLFRVEFYSDSAKQVKANGYQTRIDFYGIFFRLATIIPGFNPLMLITGIFVANEDDELSSYFEKVLEKFYITRHDYKIDFFSPKGEVGLTDEDIFKRKRNNSARHTITYENKSKNNNPYGIKRANGRTYTGWTSGKRSNNYVYTRFYQKQNDIFAKGLDMLYRDYLDYDGEIRRLEFEFGSRFTTAEGKIGLLEELTKGTQQARILAYMGLVNFEGSCFSKSYKMQDYSEGTPERIKMQVMTRGIKTVYDLLMMGFSNEDIQNTVLKLGKQQYDIEQKRLENLDKLDKSALNVPYKSPSDSEGIHRDKKLKFGNDIWGQLGIDMD